MNTPPNARRRARGKPFRDRLTLPLLLLLTIVGGVLRFVSLDRPTVWGDEAATYGRVAGTYQQLLDQLVDSSFPPLHYELEWWVGQGLPYWGTFAKPAYEDAPRTFTPTRFIVPGGIRLTPFALRFIPALAGTLFVPAMYFLAVQLFGRRIALLTALLACVSAYALVYARDAKMYMHFWLACTLHVGCLLWWLRTRRLLPWACWILCGVAMVGLHGSGFVLLALDALIVLTTRRQNWLGFFTVVPLLVWAVVLPLARIGAFVRRRRGWAAPRTDWRRYAVYRHRAGRRFAWPTVIGLVVGLLVVRSAAYSPLGFYQSFNVTMQQESIDRRAQHSTGEYGIHWVALYNEGRTLTDYLLYTTSAYLTGWEWPKKFAELGIDDQARIPPVRLRLLQAATIGLLALLAFGLVPWRRAFSPVHARLDRIVQERRVLPAWRWRRGFWLGLWVLAVPWALYSQSVEVPANAFDAAAKVLLERPPSVLWPRAPVVLDASLDAWTKARIAATSLREQWQAAWPTYVAAWSRANVNRTAAIIAGLTALGLLLFVALRWRGVGRGAARLVCLGGVLVVASLVIGALPRRVNDDVWMPRYVGTMLPAFLMLIAVLIARQPRAVRWATLLLFAGVNLAQFGTRVWGHAEPPTGLIAADVVASQPRTLVPAQPERVTFRAYTEFSRTFFGPDPGTGTLFTPAGRYYLRMLSGVPGDVFDVRLGGYESNLQMRPFVAPDMIERDLAGSPQIERFVVWSGLRFGEVDQTDELAARLRGRFRRVNEELWPARDHWRWYEWFTIRRRTYERVGAAAAAAETRSAPGVAARS